MRLRSSPIFPILPDADVPDFGRSSRIGFFVFRRAFPQIGGLRDILTAEEQRRLWFGHGLASLIVFAQDETLLPKIRGASSEEHLAFEEWPLDGNTLQVKSIKTELASPVVVTPEDYRLAHYSALDGHSVSLFVELEHCLATAIRRSSQYIPELLPQLHALVCAINEIIDELVFLLNPSCDPPDSLPANAIEDLRQSQVIRQKRIHHRTGQVVQLNSALSYLISQAFSGVPPILQNECQVRTYSLLGIGTAFCALYSLSRCIERVFEKKSIVTIVKTRFPGMEAFDPLRTLQSFHPDKCLWGLPEHCGWKHLCDTTRSEEPNPKLVFFSALLSKLGQVLA